MRRSSMFESGCNTAALSVDGTVHAEAQEGFLGSENLLAIRSYERCGYKRIQQCLRRAYSKHFKAGDRRRVCEAPNGRRVRYGRSGSDKTTTPSPADNV